MRGGLAIAAALSAGCEVETWRNADLQVDITDAALGEGRDRLRARICVDGVGNAEEALAAGRIGFTGLPAGQPLTITVDTLSDTLDETRTGRAGPLALSADAPYSAEAWTPCEGEGCEACQASGDLAGPDEVDWLLAVRFLDE